MGIPAKGSVVLVPFPFSDLSESKLRPALVVADAGKGDWVLSQITSKPYADSSALPISESDFSEGGLRTTSYVRPGKIFTANQGIFVSVAGNLNHEARATVAEAIIALIQFP